MGARARKGGEGAAKEDYERRLREINDALLVSSVRQHKATERAKRAVAALREAEKKLRALHKAMEQRAAERTAALTGYQQRLRALVKELGRAESSERTRIAQELHDNLATLLAVCKIKVSAIEASAPPGSQTASEAQLIKQFLAQALDYTRTLMSDLRPEALDEHDVTAAIQWVALRMKTHGLTVRVDDDGDPKPLEGELVALVFDSVRELLFNVVKHARTNQATVAVCRANGEVRVTVSDAGAGFTPRRVTVPSEQGGFGLFSISERLSLLGGRTEVESARGRGTRVSLIVPLSSHPGADRPARKARRRTPHKAS